MLEPNAIKALADWYQQPLGMAIAEAERLELTAILSNIYGYYLVHVGASAAEEISSPIAHRVFLNQYLDQQLQHVSIWGSYENLPFKTGSIDVVLLSHVLEFANEPMLLLQEAWHALIASGYLIVVAFNPYSLCGLWKALYGGKETSMPWTGKFYSLMQIRKWLHELSYEIVEMKTVFFRPPLANSHWHKRLGFMEPWGRKLCPHHGGIEIVVAKKKVFAVTPLKPCWNESTIFANKGFEPTTRSFRREVYCEGS